MIFKVKINCRKCECSFELSPKGFLLRDALSCPNCGQAFPQQEYELLKQGISSLGKLPKYIADQQDEKTDDMSSLFSKVGFEIEVKEDASATPYSMQDSFASLSPD